MDKHEMKKPEEIAHLRNRIAKRVESPFITIECHFRLQGWMEALLWVTEQGDPPLEIILSLNERVLSNIVHT